MVHTIKYLLLIISSLSSIDTFYLPGLRPNVFCRNKIPDSDCKTQLPVFVNRLDSIESVLPYEYSYFDFCTDDDHSKSGGNLGQVLFGDRIQSSPYKFDFLENKDCVLVCRKKYNSTNGIEKKLQRLMKAMLLNYQQHWIIDNMPVTLCYRNKDNKQYCDRGFPVGCYVNRDGKTKSFCNFPNALRDMFYVYNHLDFKITYHSGQDETWGTAFGEDGGRIISAKVELHSIESEDCDHDGPALKFASTNTEVEIPYTYSVKFIRNNGIRWASRWDYILVSSSMESNVNWFSIANSLFVVLLLSGIVAIVFLRTLCKDISHYNRLMGHMSEEDESEELGWKLIHGDVFRAPNKSMLLSVLIGNGVQIIIMLLITLVCAYFGFLSPARRGAFMTCVVVSYVLLGTPAGYTSARFYKMFGGENLKKNIIMTAISCPGVLFTIFLVLNIVVRAHDSSGAIPFKTLLLLLVLWLCVSTPLVALGAYLGFRKSGGEFPVKTNLIPREIPEQPFYQRLSGFFLVSILPFGCIFIQLFYIFNSIWAHQYYYFFGFLLVVYFILILTCSEATVLLCYFYLSAEDYKWWWRSFITPGFSTFYFILYSIYFFTSRLQISDPVSIFVYFGYTLMLAFMLFILTGTIGFLACFWFVRGIYSAIKLD